MNNTNQKPVKYSSGCFTAIKVLFFIGLFFIVAMFAFSYFMDSMDEKKVMKLKEKQCSVVWNDLDSAKKLEVLSEYIDNANDIDKVLDNKETIGNVANALLKRSVKYPGTIEFGDGTKSPYFSSVFAKIVDVDKGIFTYSESFTAENKLSMKVKGSFEMKLKYNAGCKKFEVLDFEVN